MFKNSVFKPNVDTKIWFINAGIRALKTFAETMSGFLIVGLAISDVNWINALSVSCVATLASICVSIMGIPEVKAKED